VNFLTNLKKSPREVFNKILKEFSSLEELCRHYLGEFNPKYLFDEGKFALSEFAREHCPLLGCDLFWIEEGEADEEEETITLWCIFEDDLDLKTIKESLEALKKKTEELTSFSLEFKIDEEGNYVFMIFKVG